MSVKIRLRRMGRKKQPHYRVVVADALAPRDGRFVETVGHYNPLSQPARVVLDLERVDHWMEQGATPTDTVRSLITKVRKGGDEKVAVGPRDVEAEKQAQAEALAARRKAEAEAAAAEAKEAKSAEAAAKAESGAEAEGGDEAEAKAEAPADEAAESDADGQAADGGEAGDEEASDEASAEADEDTKGG